MSFRGFESRPLRHVFFFLPITFPVNDVHTPWFFENVFVKNQYDPYGKTVFLNADGTVKTYNILNRTYLFQGRRLIEFAGWHGSELQTYHFRNREYSPKLGRFFQRDPIGIWGEGINLGNGYAFVGNGPVTKVDPYEKKATCKRYLGKKPCGVQLDIPDVKPCEHYENLAHKMYEKAAYSIG